MSSHRHSRSLALNDGQVVCLECAEISWRLAQKSSINSIFCRHAVITTASRIFSRGHLEQIEPLVVYAICRQRKLRFATNDCLRVADMVPLPASAAAAPLGGRGRCLATTLIGRRGAVTSPGADLTVPADAYCALPSVGFDRRMLN